MAEEIQRLRRECSRDIEDLRPLRKYKRFCEEIDAKREWLARLMDCRLCHGTGVKLEAVITRPQMITDDGMVRVGRVIGDSFYTDWEPYQPGRDGPQTKEVWCAHR